MRDTTSQLSETGFNSRTPGGVRRRATCSEKQVTTFQFTHPGRGATPLDKTKRVLRHLVSIHAPREGCDSFGSLRAL